MRSWWLTALLVATATAGCFSDGPADDRLLLSADAIQVPDGATLIETAEGLALQWLDVSLPLEATIAIPAGATRVTITAEAPETEAVSVSMAHNETGRRRCNQDVVHDWDNPILGTRRCSGLTAIDPPGAVWKIRASSGFASADKVTVTFSDEPLDGIVGSLDLSQLSMPEHELLPTTVETVASFDGTPLRVEVTLPDGEGPWPTVLASSPYNGQLGRYDGTTGTPAMWDYFTHDWAKRGYAIVNADVRGFGLSGGCVEVWGENEQKDQAFLVDWVADQPWSDGNVGFYGQSYVGTTPVAAAVQAPEALKAIIAVAPVINAYEDWHFGGVPNGENSLSPLSYQGALAPLGLLNPVGFANGLTAGLEEPEPYLSGKVGGLCHPQLVAEANDPRAIYTDYYAERDFKLRAGAVKAATLYTQGFYDSNVKSQMIPEWFDAIEAPKLGLFGPWVHQHPTRADEEILFLGWMDQYVKGRDLGLDGAPAVEVVLDDHTYRQADTWPATDAPTTILYPDFAAGSLGDVPTDGNVRLDLDPTGSLGAALDVPSVTLSTPITEETVITGGAYLHVVGHLEESPNAHLAAFLYDVAPDDTRQLVTWGMFNLAHRNGHDQYAPVEYGELVTVDLPLLPAEHILRPGHTLEIQVRSAHHDDWTSINGVGFSPVGGAGHFMLHGGADGARLVLPTIDAAELAPLPYTAAK